MKAARDKQYIICRGTSIQMRVDFSSETLEANNIFQVLNEKHCQPQIIYLVKISFRNEEKIKTFRDKGKLKECVAIGPTLKHWLKEIFK